MEGDSKKTCLPQFSETAMYIKSSIRPPQTGRCLSSCHNRGCALLMPSPPKKWGCKLCAGWVVKVLGTMKPSSLYPETTAAIDPHTGAEQ